MTDKAQVAEILKELKRSKLPIAKFAKQKGIAVTTLYGWKKKNKTKLNGHSKEPMFLQVGATPSIEIKAKNGVVLLVPLTISAEQLKTVVEALS